MRKEFKNLDQMQHWLKGAVGITILAVGLQSNLETLYTNITSPSNVASAIAAQRTYEQYCSSHLPCFVDFQDALDNKDSAIPSYEEFIGTFLVHVNLVGSEHNRRDGLAELLAEIGDRDFMVRSQHTGNGYRLDVLLVNMPENPAEVVELRDTLRRKSFMVVVPDGSGQMHLGNIYWGRGISPS